MSDHTPTYDGDFEVHVTVETADQHELTDFRQWCESRGMKCVRIVLSRGEHVEQPMATWRRAGATLPVVTAEATDYAEELTAGGFRVTRVKVEAAPFNAHVPVEDADAANHASSNYFEHHLKVVRDADACRNTLTELCQQHRAHLSRNAFRQVVDKREERFVTLRTYNAGRNTSMAELTALLTELRAAGEEVVEHESEYCVYDSNINLDAGWLPK